MVYTRTTIRQLSRQTLSPPPVIFVCSLKEIMIVKGKKINIMHLTQGCPPPECEGHWDCGSVCQGS